MFLKVGHRGARAYEIENTLASFKRAIELGVNAIEFDMRITRDKKLVIIHDETLKKVFGHDIHVNQSSLSELRRLTGGAIPTFEEALEFINDKVSRVLAEIKEEGYEGEVLKGIRKQGLHDRVIIVSFHEQALSRIRELDGSIETGLIYTRHKTPIPAALGLNAQYLLPLYRFVHTRDIVKAHAGGLKVIVWTINTREEAMAYNFQVANGVYLAAGMVVHNKDICEEFIQYPGIE